MIILVPEYSSPAHRYYVINDGSSMAALGIVDTQRMLRKVYFSVPLPAWIISTVYSRSPLFVVPFLLGLLMLTAVGHPRYYKLGASYI